MTSPVRPADDFSCQGDPFTLTVPDTACVPLLIAAPHGGRAYSRDLVERMRRPDSTTLRLEDRMVDYLAREIADRSGASALIAHAPRAEIDLNRSVEDVDWSMIQEGPPDGVRHSFANRRSRSGLGLVPRRVPGLGEIWRGPISNGELERRISGIHQPYHRALGNELQKMRDRWGAALLIDIHSMPPIVAREPGEIVAEYVIGDRFGSSCDAMISARALNYLSSRNRPVAHNRPYSGGYVLERHGAPMRGIHALQIEICRSTYLDSELCQPTPRMASVAELMSDLALCLVRELNEGRGDPEIQAIAAE